MQISTNKEPQKKNDPLLARRRIHAGLAGGLGIAATGAPLSFGAGTAGSVRNERLIVYLNRQLGLVNIGRFGGGHGGYCDEPTWIDRAFGEVHAPRSKKT